MICRGNSPIPIPISEMALETSTWLNLCFVEKILRKSEGDNSIQVIDIFSKPATNKGDNYTSEMVRVTAEFTRNQGNRKISEKKSIIVKIAPSNEGTLKDLVRLTYICYSHSHREKQIGIDNGADFMVTS